MMNGYYCGFGGYSGSGLSNGIGGFFSQGMMGIGLVGMILNVLFILVIIWAIVTAIRYFRNRNPKGNSALEALRQEYATGRINEEEFLHRRQVLGDKE